MHVCKNVFRPCCGRASVVARQGGLGELAGGCLHPIRVRCAGVQCLWSWLRTLAGRGPRRSLTFPLSQNHGQWFSLNCPWITQVCETPNLQFFYAILTEFFPRPFSSNDVPHQLGCWQPSQIRSQISRTLFTSVEGCQVTQARTWLFYLSCSYHAYLSLSANFAWRFCENQFSCMIQIFLVPGWAGNTP